MTTSNPYAQHLAEVNNVQNVVVADDILNAQGQILVKKGTPINKNTAEKIARFKLSKPIEQSVLIEKELTSKSLMQKFSDYFNRDPSLSQLFTQFNDAAQLKVCTDYFEKFPLVRQKITVLAIQMPAKFEQALFCSWFSVALSKRILNSDSAHKDLFIAALCHDIGMVHISQDTLNKKQALTLEEWKLIQSHPVISYNILKEISGIKPIASRAVLEHHENLDGTGYPRGCLGSLLCHEGQLINLLDSINAVFKKHFLPTGRSIKEVLPILQMNQHSRFGPAAKHLILMLRELTTEPKPTMTQDLAEELIKDVRVRHDYISQCLDICSDLANELGFRNENPEVVSLQNAIIHITMSIAQSGIVNEAYMRWLQQVQQEFLAHAYNEVEEAFLMMQEIIYHIGKLIRQLELCIEKTQADISKTLTQTLENLKAVPTPGLSAESAKSWGY